MVNVEFKLDIALVIDATSSMGPIIDVLKCNARSFGDRLVEAMHYAGKDVTKLRVRVIDFADFATEGDETIHATDFFELPEENDKFDESVNYICRDYRGGEGPDNALEALYVAMKSDWVHIGPGERGRHLIILITDAFPLKLREREDCFGYNKDAYPHDIEELAKIWHENEDLGNGPAKLSRYNKRLLSYIPEGCDNDSHTWDPVLDWDYNAITYVDINSGLEGIDFVMMITDMVRIM